MAARFTKELPRCRRTIAEDYRPIAETQKILPPLAKNYRAFAFMLKLDHQQTSYLEMR